MKNRREQGFTLIELLIVIAIIGILAAVLIPNLLGARKRAYDTTAQACAKSLAAAATQYKIDNPSLAYPAYSDLTGSTALSAKYGTNGCNGLIITGGAAADTNTTYSYVIGHLNGTNTYTVTESGITPANPAVAATGTATSW